MLTAVGSESPFESFNLWRVDASAEALPRMHQSLPFTYETHLNTYGKQARALRLLALKVRLELLLRHAAEEFGATVALGPLRCTLSSTAFLSPSLSFTLSPNDDNQYNTVYEREFYFPADCETLLQKTPSPLVVQFSFSGVPVLRDPAPALVEDALIRCNGCIEINSVAYDLTYLLEE